MQKTLLERSRAINKILQKMEGNKVDFYEMAAVLSENLECSVFILGRGRIGGYAFTEGAGCSQVEYLMSHTESFPESLNQELISVQETVTNIVLKEGRKCVFNINNTDCDCSRRIWSITPVFAGGRRIGSLILVRRSNKQFRDEDIVLAEYGAIVVANEIMRMRSERIEEKARKKASVQIALATLSYSEKEAIEHIIAELDSKEGLLVASRIADKVGITRSVIVSALRKFESAGVIESRSLGMKGTYIKVLNNYLFEELSK